MINILEPFVAWVTALKQDKFRFATLKLTFFYVLSTAVILFVSSFAVLLIFAPPETELPFAFDSDDKTIEIEHDEWSMYELREHLATVIFSVDVPVLIIVSAFAYLFARRTLLPIKLMHKTQQKFMSDVAHELRTPLSVMQIGADTILRQARSAVEYQDFVTDVQTEAGRLTRLSNQLLQLLKNSEQQLKFSKENISTIVETEVRRFLPYAKEQKINLMAKIDPDVIINTGKDSLIEVLQNLLKNAIDYNQPEGEVTVSLVVEGARLKLKVQDTGIGIPIDKQKVIFDRFTKADFARTSDTNRGSGLGLAIVKSLVNKLGGTIDLKSVQNIGTTITISLPLSHS